MSRVANGANDQRHRPTGQSSTVLYSVQCTVYSMSFPPLVVFFVPRPAARFFLLALEAESDLRHTHTRGLDFDRLIV
jgi:hypothetical protein